jgi:ATP-binding cassette subfamily F protein 3
MEKLAPVLTASDFSFEFREPLSLPNPMLAMDGMACGYGETIIVRDITTARCWRASASASWAPTARASRLSCKTVARAMAPLAGTLTEGKGLAIATSHSRRWTCCGRATRPSNHMIRLARDAGPPGREQELRNFLGQFRFEGDMVNQRSAR